MSKTFEDKLAARRRRGGAAQSAAPDEGESVVADSVRAAAVLTALEWIERVLSTVDWGRVRQGLTGIARHVTQRILNPRVLESNGTLCRGEQYLSSPSTALCTLVS